jgi:serine/threonine protein kinase
VPAPSLQSYRDRKGGNYCTLEYNDARRILYGIGDALSFIHAKGITHDDIKPANILYSDETGPVLIDFGWSSAGSGHCAGSPWYIPPEVMKSGRRGPPGDAFALGVVELFILRLIPLPECLPPPRGWQISDLRKRGPDARKAAKQMGQWLEIVKDANSNLGNIANNVLDKSVKPVVNIISRMLVFKPKARITANRLFSELRRL